MHHSVSFKRAKGEDAVGVGSFVLHGEEWKAGFVLDGHGGKEAMLKVRDTLLPTLREEAEKGEDVETCLRKVFARVGKSVESLSSGCCATLVCASEKTLVVANTGDCTSILVPFDERMRHTLLTTSHAFNDSPQERERVTRKGARVDYATNQKGEKGGPLRGWPGGLTVGRSFGDADCKKYVTDSPSISITEWDPSSCVVVVASDGVWDALPSHVVVKVARRHSPASKIVDVAWGKRRTDDVTCLLLSGHEFFVPSHSNKSILACFSSSSDSLASLEEEEEEEKRRQVSVPL